MHDHTSIADKEKEMIDTLFKKTLQIFEENKDSDGDSGATQNESNRSCKNSKTIAKGLRL